VRLVDEFRHPRFQFIDADASLALGFLRRAFQPKIVDLRQNPIFPPHPPIPKRFEIRFAVDYG